MRGEIDLGNISRPASPLFVDLNRRQGERRQEPKLLLTQRF
jgi:hypothetical protein